MRRGARVVGAFAWALAACGSPLHLQPDPGDGNTPGNGVHAPVLKCASGAISNAQISNCTCSTGGGQTCPQYAADPNAGTETWGCTSIPVAGGYVYSCECATARDPNDGTPACGAFYNPADPSAVANDVPAFTTCSTAATSFGYQTTCTCTDTDTAPCDFYQGNSYTDDTTTYVEVCGSTLNATGVATVCTCNQTLQNPNAICPASFTPSASTVTDLIY